MPLKISFETTSPDKEPQIVKDYVQTYKDEYFSKFYTEHSEKNFKDYFSKIITHPKNPTDWVAYYYCPDFPRTSNCQLLFVTTVPKLEQHKPGHYFVEMYHNDEAKDFLAEQNR